MQVNEQTRGDVLATYPLSLQQRHLWLRPDRARLVAQCAVLVEGGLDAGTLQSAVRLVVDRHEILRTTYDTPPGLKLPLQAVREWLDFEWEERARRRPEANGHGDGADAVVPEAEAAETLSRQAAEPFDLARGPLLRVALSRLGERRHLLALTLPALCADAAGLRNLVAEIGNAYAHLTRSAPFEGEPLPYSAFSSWQNELERADDEEAEEGRDYWRRQNLAALAAMSLGEGQGGTPESFEFEVGAELTAALDALSRRLDISGRAVLAACWHLLVSRLTGSPEVIVGEMFEGRPYEEFEGALGSYAQCLPVGSGLKARQRFSSFARRLQELQNRAVERGLYAAFDDEIKFTVGFEYDEWPTPQAHDGLSFTLLRRRVAPEVFQLKLIAARRPGRLSAAVSFDPQRVRRADALLLEGRLVALLHAIVHNPSVVVGDLPTLGAAERHLTLFEFNDTETDFEPRRGVTELFEAQAALNPDAIAVVYGEHRLTYAELNRRANNVAYRLAAEGLEVEQRVGLWLERSERLVLGLLGVLKAGGAYLPLDPASPPDRIAMLLADSGVRLVLTEEGLAEALPPGGGVKSILLHEAMSGRGGHNPRPAFDAGNLAYVLFTSGSTGRPKGVGVEHRQLLNYVNAVGRRLALPPGSRFATVSTFAADLGNTMIFPSLCGGGTLHVVAQEVASDPNAFGSYMRAEAIDCLKIVPSHLAALLLSGRPQEMLPSRLLVLGGEAAPAPLVEQVRELAPDCRLMNHYGPTETTVGVLTLERPKALPRPEGVAAPLPLGRPLANCEIYLLDRDLQPVPAGTPGELCIGGDCLSRGYLAQPRMTAEKFVPNPVERGAGRRIYRTGDLARMSPQGEVEFLGRIDSQVKIRGYRIELGEIEAALATYPDVWKAVAVARETAGQGKQLVAYVVARRGHELSQLALRAHLAQSLPEYMLPSAIVLVESIPLTPNGKLNRDALPAPEHAAEHGGTHSEQPRTAEEKALAEIWAQVLGLPAVGINDNFFALGGDSILAIQVVARANRLRLRLTPKQVFDKQTIAELAAVAGAAPEARNEQGIVTGAAPLTPIQRWFVEQNFVEPHHWNQSVLLEVPATLDPRHVEAAAQHLVAQHDALRLHLRQGAQGWEQSFADMEGSADCFVIVNLSGVTEAEAARAVESEAARLQAGLSLSEGPVARFALFDFGEGRTRRLLIVVHHLAVDGVSWRILLEDLEVVCEQLSRSEEVELPPKTCSFKQWAQRLADYAASGAAADEAAFWLQLEDGPHTPLLQDRSGPKTFASARSLTTSLAAEETTALLQELPEVYGTQVNELLLTAVARGFTLCTGSPVTLLDMEGHGREAVAEDLDISRTVGWFTTHYPVRLDLGVAESPAEALKLVKEQLRKIPGHGIGYGLLRYMSLEPDVADRFRALPVPEIKFNYLGQFDNTLSSPELFRMAAESAGPQRDPRSTLTHLLNIDAILLGGRLHLRWTYSENVYAHERVSRLAEAVADELRALVRREGGAAADSYAPSDFPLAGLDVGRLERIASALPATPGEGQGRRHIEDIYPVSPLQEGLLFYSLSTAGSGVGFEQKSLLLRGDLDLAAFAQTWQELVNRHPLLRTAFYAEGSGCPLQVVHRHAQMSIEQLDWRARPAHEQQADLERYLRADRERGFDTAAAPLMRAALIRLADDTHRFVWSYHHLLIDAWCRNLLLQEVSTIYDAFHNGHVPELPGRRPYRDYIAWLQKQDMSAAEQFWRDALKGCTAPTRLPVGLAAATRAPREEAYKTLRLQLSAAETQLLAAFAQQNRLTLNTVVHGAWSMLLSRYCGTHDVLFGTTVSGRPSELADADSILGMFINNLPVRVRLAPEEPVVAALSRLQEQLAAAREYEWVSPSKLQEWSDVPPGRRMFESLLVFQNYPGDHGQLDPSADLQILDMQSRLETSYPLTLVAGPFDPLTVRVFYDSGRFDELTMARLAEHLKTLLNSFAAAPAPPTVSAADMLTEPERHQLLHEYNDTSPSDTERRCLHQFVEKQAERAPQEVALEWRGESLSWRQLNRRANRLARRLTKAGAGQASPVAVLLEPGPVFAVALLAALKAGAAFVILDPAADADCIARHLRNARARVLLSTEGLRPKVHAADVIFVPAEGEEQAVSAERNLRKRVSPEHVAWLHYGVDADRPAAVTHEELVGHARNLGQVISPGGSDIVLLAAPAVETLAAELLEALAAGVRVRLADASDAAGPERLRQLVEDSGATVMQALPETWGLLLKSGWEGGENFTALCPCKRLVPRLARELAARVGRVFKIYRTGVAGRWLAVSRVGRGASHDEQGLLGVPTTGKRIHVLSADLQLLPAGVIGEIYVGGEGTDSNPASETLPSVPDPFSPVPGALLYRTGDLGRRRDDGRIEYRGRVGRSVEVMGDLADLYEVEVALTGFEGLHDVAVKAWENGVGERQLVAYIVADYGAMPGVERLLDFGRARLPRHAVPDLFVGLDVLPLAPGGEVDYEVLPPPDREGVQLEVPFLGFRDPVELRLKRIWEDLFGIRSVGLRDNFFELGGHSLLAVRLMGEIRREFGRELPLATLLKGATIEYLAEILRSEDGAGGWSSLVQLQGGGDRLPLFCVHPMGGEVLCYMELARHLGREQPLYGLQSRAFADGQEEAPHRVEEMAANYLEAVREMQPRGPYHLAGFSFGGLVALEMARQLVAAGEEPGLLCILDTYLGEERPAPDGDAADPQPDKPVMDWTEMLLWFARHTSSVSAEDLRRFGTLEEQVSYAIEHGVLPYNLDLSTALRYIKSGEDNTWAKRRYVPRPYQGRIVLLRALRGHVLKSPEPTLGWGRVAAGGLDIYDVPGDHLNMLERPYVQTVADMIKACLRGRGL
ncbi:MAG: amino acid adenylation domain-containing protein [Pyrinomonadaceae bacterium]